MVIVSRSYVEIGIEKEEGSRIAEEVMFCSLLHIVRIENLDGQNVPAA